VLPGYVVHAYQVSAVFKENNNLITRTVIDLSVIMKEDMFEDRKRAILQRCF
jgi:hypothetical protein